MYPFVEENILGSPNLRITNIFEEYVACSCIADDAALEKVGVCPQNIFKSSKATHEITSYES